MSVNMEVIIIAETEGYRELSSIVTMLFIQYFNKWMVQNVLIFGEMGVVLTFFIIFLV